MENHNASNTPNYSQKHRVTTSCYGEEQVPDLVYDQDVDDSHFFLSGDWVFFSLTVGVRTHRHLSHVILSLLLKKLYRFKDRYV